MSCEIGYFISTVNLDLAETEKANTPSSIIGKRVTSLMNVPMISINDKETLSK
jgi:hypothetical protein